MCPAVRAKTATCPRLLWFCALGGLLMATRLCWRTGGPRRSRPPLVRRPRHKNSAQIQGGQGRNNNCADAVVRPFQYSRPPGCRAPPVQSVCRLLRAIKAAAKIYTVPLLTGQRSTMADGGGSEAGNKAILLQQEISKLQVRLYRGGRAAARCAGPQLASLESLTTGPLLRVGASRDAGRERPAAAGAQGGAA